MAGAKRKQPINAIQGLEARAEASFKELYNEILTALEGISPFDKDVLAYRAVQVALEKVRYSERVQQTVADASLAAANNALGPLAKVQADKYIRWRMNEVYDGVTLSQRLRRNATETAEILTNTIRTQLKNGGTWTQLAEKITKHDKVSDISVTLAELAKAGKKMNVDPLEINSLAGRAQRYISKLSPNDAPTSYLKAAYQELINTVEKRAGAAAVDKALKDAIDAKVKYNAERISRTEIARAHNEAFHTRHDFDPDVTGYQWTLSSRHHITDECTMIAELDNGAGPGVYRKENCPQLPVHPNCMCMLVPYTGELPEKTTFKTFRDYLAEQPDKKRADIIGKANAVNPVLYRRGLEKRGLDPDNPGVTRRIPAELVVPVPAVEPQNLLQKDLYLDGKSGIFNKGGSMDGFRQVNTGGLRNEKPLTEAQKAQAKSYAVSLGMPEESIYVLDNTLTGYGPSFDELVIGTDVVPQSKRGKTPNENISLKGAIAHEIIGHRETVLSGKDHNVEALDEAQASIRAARFAPDLSMAERMILIRDGITRLRDAGIHIKDVKYKLHINER